ncbi:hypothetical protein EXIGLDRAFT_759362 [Exidia glandulosa HHB12029]|uniref:Uncharacterized protein n=1 Tax=Exidia glandulosa HHB12029 TaxID=1314781 RepID=A0A166BPW3_EXIGL|nr:hypothetical protein EXIGLDRAFT_759362 [Exidia glandulosa HHB12029]
MLFRSVVASLFAASAVYAAAVVTPEEPFNPTVAPLATPVYDFVEQPLTNAERLRRGMAPMPPKMKRFGLHAPGPVRPPTPEPSAAPPQPSGGASPDPDLQFDGIIQVADANTNKVIGYVSGKLTVFGQFGVDKNQRNPVQVSFATTRANQQPGSIKITNGDSRTGKFFGAVASQWMLKGIMGKGKNMFSYLARTAETKAGVGPMDIGSSIFSMLGLRLKAESAIWTVNPTTGELSSQWTNTGGKVFPTTVFYYKSLNALAISYDKDAFHSAHSDAVPVKLTIVPAAV